MESILIDEIQLSGCDEVHLPINKHHNNKGHVEGHHRGEDGVVLLVWKSQHSGSM